MTDLTTVESRLEALTERVAALEVGKQPTFLERLDAFHQAHPSTPESEAAQRDIDREIKRARAQERFDLGLDDPPIPVFKDWRLVVGIISDPELYREVTEAGAAIRRAERDDIEGEEAA